MRDNTISVRPECRSSRVTSQYHQTFMVNTGEHYCHSMKTHDPESPSRCLDCSWSGELRELATAPDLKAVVKERRERAKLAELKTKYEVG